MRGDDCAAGEVGVSEYTHESHGTPRAVVKLPSGPVEIWATNPPDEFATDRAITQDEYDQIRLCLIQLMDNAAMQSIRHGLLK